MKWYELYIPECDRIELDKKIKSYCRLYNISEHEARKLCVVEYAQNLGVVVDLDDILG